VDIRNNKLTSAGYFPFVQIESNSPAFTKTIINIIFIDFYILSHILIEYLPAPGKWPTLCHLSLFGN
jgi:hypothetical protein